MYMPSPKCVSNVHKQPKVSVPYPTQRACPMYITNPKCVSQPKVCVQRADLTYMPMADLRYMPMANRQHADWQCTDWSTDCRNTCNSKTHRSVIANPMVTANPHIPVLLPRGAAVPCFAARGLVHACSVVKVVVGKGNRHGSSHQT